MKKFVVLACSLISFGSMCSGQVSVSQLLAENETSPTGLTTAHPRFSWQIQSQQRNTFQSAYEIKVSNGKYAVWHSGRVNSDSSVHVTYKGSPLQSNEKYQWQVKVWDQNGKSSIWSTPASFQMGLLTPSDWKAQWIESGIPEAPSRPSQLFRKSFSTNKKVKSATAYITSHGMYEAYLNGKRIGDAWLTPGWTSYNKRLQYQSYDVTHLLQQGANIVGAMLGNGWYRSVLGWQNNGDIYGKTLGLLLQVNIEYTDGSKEIVATDGSWKSETGAVTYSEIYNGETIDARQEKPNWNNNNYDDKSWAAVQVKDYPLTNIITTVNEPVKKQEAFKALKIITTPAGEKVIDFGQNLVGWVEVKVAGKAGDSVLLSHAEVLDKKGNFYTENLRAAKAQNKYILKGGSSETFTPHFTWQGFRYVKVEGYPGELKPEHFTAYALYSDMKPTGVFNSSDSLINQLQHNIQWGQKGNFLDVPTDCPQRDERLGWTGDAQAFSRTASFNMNVNNFFAKWMRDVEADQVDGLVPHVIPNVLGKDGNSAGWADVATIVPWDMYIAYGDKRILATQYNSMKAFVESVRRTTKDDLWNTTWHFGDWLFYRPFDDNDGSSAVTDKHLIAQCFYAHSTQLLINTAKVLGNEADAATYTGLLQKIKAAFNKEYVTATGRLVSGSQTAYVLALQFDMLPENSRMQAADRLVENIKRYNNHLTTGFLGTPYLCHVLTRFGHSDLAYTLLMQDTYPSWLYPVKMGATTIWERWDGIKTDGSFQTPTMNSFNHYAYGAIGDWMYRKMVGLDTYEDGAGYKHIQVKPYIGGKFTHASASLQTYYGRLSNAWKKDSTGITMQVEIPANTRATIYIPGSDVNKITEHGSVLSSSKSFKIRGQEEGYTVVETGSGKYAFVVKP